MSTNPQFFLRTACPADIPALHDLIACSVRGLMTGSYTEQQLEASLGLWLGVDSQLVNDGTYFIVETEDNGTRVLVGCGGWSGRKTPYGSDHRPGREDALLDPATDAAKIRAFFVHPNWARRGIGALILDHCERAALGAGFRRCEMGATLSGVPFYRSHGYQSAEQIELPLPNGDTLPILKMVKDLAVSDTNRQ
ncbi:MAG: GNAT family N-acetyltransferase [Terriglobia bacterium]|nr:GNAT family N-acetyltransferase [Terriglobia bacterium]